jgi:hypothetical protein
VKGFAPAFGERLGKTRKNPGRFQHILKTLAIARDWLAVDEAQAMTRKRNRSRPELPFGERLSKFGADARAAAKKLPPGAERSELLQKARDSEAAARIERWLSSPGLQSPK